MYIYMGGVQKGGALEAQKYLLAIYFRPASASLRQPSFLQPRVSVSDVANSLWDRCLWVPYACPIHQRPLTVILLPPSFRHASTLVLENFTGLYFQERPSNDDLLTLLLTLAICLRSTFALLAPACAMLHFCRVHKTLSHH